MPSITIDVRDFGIPASVPAEGTILIRPILPLLGEDHVTTTQEFTVDVSQVTVVDLEPGHYYFIPRNLPGLERWSFDLTEVTGSVNMAELVEDNQIDPTSLEPVTGAPKTVQDRLDELQEFVEAGGATEEQIAEAVEDYLTENPVIASNTDWGDDPKPKTVFENGLV